MQELLKTLHEIDIDYYKGIYNAGEMSDLIRSINNLLKNQSFI